MGGQHHSSVPAKEEVKRSWDTVMKVQSPEGHTYVKQNKRSVFPEKVTQQGKIKNKKQNQKTQKLHSQT